MKCIYKINNEFDIYFHIYDYERNTNFKQITIYKNNKAFYSYLFCINNIIFLLNCDIFNIIRRMVDDKNIDIK